MEGMVWLILMIVFLVIEIITVGLTSIWMAGGSLAAFVVYKLGGELLVQMIVFLVVSVILMICTRPFAKKYINSNRTKTNYEEVIGKLVKVTERIDNLNGTGTAVVNGQEWTARANDPEELFEPNAIVRVVKVEGVKLIVERE